MPRDIQLNSVEDLLKYQSLRKPLKDRLARYKISDAGCFEWLGAKDHKGYGNLIVKGPNGLRQIGAHKLSYMTFVGPVTPGLYVLHRCDNPACINPEHLFLGTQAENIRDMDSKNRRGLGHRQKVIVEAMESLGIPNPRALLKRRLRKNRSSDNFFP